VIKVALVVLWESMAVAEHHSTSALYPQKLYFLFTAKASRLVNLIYFLILFLLFFLNYYLSLYFLLLFYKFLISI